MSGLKININVEAIAAQFKEYAAEMERSLNEGVKALAAQTHAHVAEEAAQTLKSSLKTFQDNLGFEEVSPGVWVVSIAEDALWIEEGIEPGKDMKPDLLKNAMAGKSGRYQVIPFDPKKNPAAGVGVGPMPTGPKQNQATINQQLKDGLKMINKEGRAAAKKDGGQWNNVNLRKIEKDENGSPRIGKLHEFDLTSINPTAKAKHPALKGLTIYQSKDDKGNVRRDVLTFRTVSDNSPADSWRHPGFQAKKFLDEAEMWAMNEWENKILPEILKSFGGK